VHLLVMLLSLKNKTWSKPFHFVTVCNTRGGKTYRHSSTSTSERQR